MFFKQALNESDAQRLTASLQRLRGHATADWALTGGLAVSIHRARSGFPVSTRPLNDLDFVVARFDCIPPSLASEYLCRHIHPLDPPGKTLAQFIDANTRLRIDVFMTAESVLSRTTNVTTTTGVLRIVSAEDLTARLVRILLQIADGIPVASKHARDFVQLMEIVDRYAMQPIWGEHRQAGQLEDFEEAAQLTLSLITTQQHLLVVPPYSTEVSARCQRCIPTTSFPLADARLVLSILGYC